MTVAEYKDHLKTQPMPEYSKGEEIFNYVSHGLGVLIGFFVFGYVIALSFINNFNAWQVVSLIAWALAIIALYATSTVYHALKKRQHH